MKQIDEEMLKKYLKLGKQEIIQQEDNVQKDVKKIRQLEWSNKKEETEQLVEYDKYKTKILKYIMYKKRTKKEVEKKFSSSIERNMLEDIIDDLEEKGYINDENYIERAVNEFMAISILSMKEIRYKLYSKGLNSGIIDTYFVEHEEELKEYELNCAKKIAIKKQLTMEQEEIKQFLKKKGYSTESIKMAINEL